MYAAYIPCIPRRLSAGPQTSPGVAAESAYADFLSQFAQQTWIIEPGYIT